MATKQNKQDCDAELAATRPIFQRAILTRKVDHTKYYGDHSWRNLLLGLLLSSFGYAIRVY